MATINLPSVTQDQRECIEHILTTLADINSSYIEDAKKEVEEVVGYENGLIYSNQEWNESMEYVRRILSEVANYI